MDLDFGPVGCAPGIYVFSFPALVPQFADVVADIHRPAGNRPEAGIEQLSLPIGLQARDRTPASPAAVPVDEIATLNALAVFSEGRFLKPSSYESNSIVNAVTMNSV